MKLEDQLCTEIQGKKLKELGITKIVDGNDDESGFYFVTNHKAIYFYKEDGYPSMKYIAAFTSSELGIMIGLFNAIGSNITFNSFYSDFGVIKYTAYYNNNLIAERFTEAEVRAEMLIYLLENKLTTKEAVIKRFLNSM